MIPLSRELISERLTGTVLMGGEGLPFESVFTDTRRPESGGLFVALVGDRFDAHNFLSAAVEGGACGAILSRPDALPASGPEGLFVFQVEDTTEALGQLGRLVREQMEAQVIAITGSVGKTTLKEMVAAALTPFGKTGRTPGNYNNAIGLPLSIFGMDGDERFLVLELGMNAPGEIAHLTHIAKPNVGVVTGAEIAHLEFLGDIDSIADAKAELYEGLDDAAVAVANIDDPRVMERVYAHHQGPIVTYGRDRRADVRVVSTHHEAGQLHVQIDCMGRNITVALNCLGHHNAHLMAGALAVIIGLSGDAAVAAEAIARHYRPAKHRLQIVAFESGPHVLDDCYNASPVAMRAALDTLVEVAGELTAKAAVLGSMLELGDESPRFHEQLGRYAAQCGLERIYATGPYAADIVRGASDRSDIRCYASDDVLGLRDVIREQCTPETWLLLKGSRGGRLERVLGFFDDEGAEQG